MNFITVSRFAVDCASIGDYRSSAAWTYTVKCPYMRSELNRTVCAVLGLAPVRTRFATHIMREDYARYATRVRTYMAETGCTLDAAQAVVKV